MDFLWSRCTPGLHYILLYLQSIVSGDVNNIPMSHVIDVFDPKPDTTCSLHTEPFSMSSSHLAPLPNPWYSFSGTIDRCMDRSNDFFSAAVSLANIHALELYQGPHRLDKIFVHDFSMTIFSFSMTISLPDFASRAF